MINDLFFSNHVFNSRQMNEENGVESFSFMTMGLTGGGSGLIGKKNSGESDGKGGKKQDVCEIESRVRLCHGSASHPKLEVGIHNLERIT